MKHQSGHAIVSVLLIACHLLLAGCARTPVTVVEVLNHGRCSGLRTGLTWVEMSELAEIRGTRMLTDLPEQPVAAATEASDNVALLAISKGSQPTPGYRFELTGVQAQGLQVRLNFAWHTPAADAVLAQVVTSPCAVVQLSDSEKVQSVSVWVDGEVFGDVALNSAAPAPPQP